MSFSASAELDVTVNQRSLRAARNTIESELGDISVSVGSKSASRQLQRSARGRSKENAMSRQLHDRRNNLLKEQSESWDTNIHLNQIRNDSLRELLETSEKAAVTGDSGNGHSPRKSLGDGLIDGAGGLLLTGLLSNIPDSIDIPDLKPPDIPPIKVDPKPPFGIAVPFDVSIPVETPHLPPLEAPDIPPLEVPDVPPIPVDAPKSIPIDSPAPSPAPSPSPSPSPSPGKRPTGGGSPIRLPSVNPKDIGLAGGAIGAGYLVKQLSNAASAGSSTVGAAALGPFALPAMLAARETKRAREGTTWWERIFGEAQLGPPGAERGVRTAMISAPGLNEARRAREARSATQQLNVQNEVVLRDVRNLDRKLEQNKRDILSKVNQAFRAGGGGGLGGLF